MRLMRENSFYEIKDDNGNYVLQNSIEDAYSSFEGDIKPNLQEFIDLSKYDEFMNPALLRPAGEEYEKQIWNILNTQKNTKTTGSATYTSVSNKWKYASDDYALIMNLKDNPSSTEKVSNINLYMYYSVTPTRSLPNWLMHMENIHIRRHQLKLVQQ